MAGELKNLLDCDENIDADNSCVQVIQIKGGYAPIDYRKLSHKPSLDGILDPEESKGAIADAGAVGARLKALDNSSENYNKWLHDIYTTLYNNQLSDDLDDDTAELGSNKQSNIGNRVKTLEENKLDKSVIDLYEKKTDHQKDITDIRNLIPDNLIQIIQNNGLTITTNVVNDIRNIQDRLALTSDGIQLITDWNTVITNGMYYSLYDNTLNGPKTETNSNGDITSLYLGEVSVVENNGFNYIYQTVYRYYYAAAANYSQRVSIWRRKGEQNINTSSIKWGTWFDMSPIDILTESELREMMNKIDGTTDDVIGN